MRTILRPQSLFFFVSLFLMHCTDQDAENVAVSGVKIEPSAISIEIGDKEYLGAKISPDNATNKTLTWSSNNVDIADVNDQGIVSAKALGSAIITATTSNGKNATCSITVEQQSSGEVRVESVALDKQSIILEMGETEILFASVSPNNAINKTVQWTTSDENVAIVNENGVVTPVSCGNTEITITSIDGGFKASCDVEIPCDNIIPKMTDNTSPFGKASCSDKTSFFSNGTTIKGDPYRAFDDNVYTYAILYYPITKDQTKKYWWIEYEFESPQVVNKYKIIPVDDNSGMSPNKFEFQVFDNNQNDWITMHSMDGITSTKPQEYSINNSNKYNRYRLYIYKNNGDDTSVTIKSLEMGYTD